MNLSNIQMWIREEQARYDLDGIKRPSLSIAGDLVQFSGWDDWRFETGIGQTVEEAHRELRKRIPKPWDLAAHKRNEAKRLLREAHELELQHGL